jgi:hypothetical protein
VDWIVAMSVVYPIVGRNILEDVMNLQEQFEKEKREELPLLKNYEYDHEGYYSDTANYFTEYSKWLETKLQNTSSNSDYAKCGCNSTKTYTDVSIICDDCGHVQK